ARPRLVPPPPHVPRDRRADAGGTGAAGSDPAHVPEVRLLARGGRRGAEARDRDPRHARAPARAPGSGGPPLPLRLDAGGGRSLLGDVRGAPRPASARPLPDAGFPALDVHEHRSGRGRSARPAPARTPGPHLPRPSPASARLLIPIGAERSCGAARARSNFLSSRRPVRRSILAAWKEPGPR